MAVTKGQIKKIHVLWSKLGLDRDTYESMLAPYGASSSKDLEFVEAQDLIRRLQKDAIAAGVERPTPPDQPGYRMGKRRRFEDLGKRPGHASPAQLRKIEAMWMTVSNQPSDEAKRAALVTFVRNKTGVARLEWLPHTAVSKLIRTIQAMQRQKRGSNA